MRVRSLIAVLILFALPGYAQELGANDLINAPSNFSIPEGRAVFIDIQNVHTTITFDGATKTASATSTISFIQKDNGYPIFDLVEEPTRITIDGVEVFQRLVSPPGKMTSYRLVLADLKAGSHLLEVEHAYKTDVAYKNGGVATAFFFDDWHDRHYLEQYLPSNLEYDQYAAQVMIILQNTDKDISNHDIFTNANVTILNASTAQLDFPSFYNCASFYLQMAPKGQFLQVLQNFKSLDGRIIPVTTFKKASSLIDLQAFQKKTALTLTELENDYGAFPHDKILIYASSDGGADGISGMEYAGATITDLGALDHELFHSYHARSMAPSSGNSGWMDEAIASWRDEGYRKEISPKPIPTNMAGRDPYIRYIGLEPYDEGEIFLRNLAAKSETQGRDFKTFLRNYFQKRKFTIVTTDIFKADLEAYVGLDFTSDFATWVYGISAVKTPGQVQQKRRVTRLNLKHWRHDNLTADLRAQLL